MKALTRHRVDAWLEAVVTYMFEENMADPETRDTSPLDFWAGLLLRRFERKEKRVEDGLEERVSKR